MIQIALFLVTGALFIGAYQFRTKGKDSMSEEIGNFNNRIANVFKYSGVLVFIISLLSLMFIPIIWI